MRILILGAGGFLGRHLVSRLARNGFIGGRAVTELVLLDNRLAHPLEPLLAQCALTHLQGDIRDRRVLDCVFAQPVDMVFHLAATLRALASGFTADTSADELVDAFVASERTAG